MDTREASAKPGSAGTLSAGTLSAGTLAVFAIAGLPVGGYVTTLAVYLPNYYTRHLGVGLFVVGLAFFLVRVLDIVFDPILGVIMDSARPRFGRFRPWLAASIPVLMVSTWAAYFAPSGVGVVYITLCLLVLYAGYSMCVLAHAAWGTALVAEYHGRSRVYGWIQAMGVIGAIGILLAPIFVPRILHMKMEPIPIQGWFLLIVVPITFAITAIFAPEPHLVTAAHKRAPMREYFALLKRPDMVRNLTATLLTTFGPAITAPLYLFFFEDARGYSPDQANILLLIYVVAGLVGPYFWLWIARSFGKHQTIKIAAVAYAFAQTGLLLLPKAHPGEMSIAMFAVGFVASAFAFLLRAMVADICDEVRLETGKDQTALLNALATSVAKFASTVSVFVGYAVLTIFGFKAAEGAANTELAMWGLQACYLVPPVACVLIGGLCMLGYKLDEKRHGEIREQLTARDGVVSVAAGVESLGGALEPAIVNPGE